MVHDELLNEFSLIIRLVKKSFSVWQQFKPTVKNVAISFITHEDLKPTSISFPWVGLVLGHETVVFDFLEGGQIDQILGRGSTNRVGTSQ